MTEAELDAVRDYLGRRGQQPGPVEVAAALRGLGLLVSDSSVRHAVLALRRDSVGAGALDPLLAEPGVTDILVNAPDRVYLDRGRGLEPAGLVFTDEAEVRRLAVRLAASVGRRLDDGSPFVDARLPNGVRVHAILGCVADTGTCISLRVPNRKRLSLDDWVASGSLSDDAAELLKGLVVRRRAFLISGGTGSGKTTLLAALLSLVPPTERIVIAEDSRELQPDHPHCVRLEARPANAEGSGAITLTDLVRQALRMRPDRLVVGEVRGAELADLLSALNTGHEGGCGTVHANSAADVPARLEALGALGGLSQEALAARAEFKKRMTALGATVVTDDMANMYATFPGSEDLPAIASGSHLDSVRQGGNYDGVLGVLAAMEAAETIVTEKIPHRHPITIVVWTNEEGARYEPAMMSSGVLTGKFEKAAMLKSFAKDVPGYTFGEALEKSGYKGSVENRLTAEKYKALVELHIEQGPVLETEGIDIGVVEGVLRDDQLRIYLYRPGRPRRHDPDEIPEGRAVCRRQNDPVSPQRARQAGRPARLHHRQNLLPPEHPHNHPRRG